MERFFALILAASCGHFSFKNAVVTKKELGFRSSINNSCLGFTTNLEKNSSSLVKVDLNMDLLEHVLFIVGAVYFLLAERGVIRLRTQKRQLEFDERMRNKRWRYSFIILAYLVLGYSIFLIVKDLYK